MSRPFLPAAGHDVFLPLYDPIQKLLGGDAALADLVDAAAILPSQRILDIGCGTGNLILEIGRRHPGLKIVGLDPDPRALERARRKLERAGAVAQLDEGFADELPYPTMSFDRVFSSFMFHHLSADVKLATLAEVRRVLAVGGEFHLLDFARSEAREGGLLAHLFHANHQLRDNTTDRLVELLRAADFRDVRELSHRARFIGRIAHFRGVAQGDPIPNEGPAA
jgi:ubiquinone/menaquinone biosynthesis C-methylase UbiE